MKTAAGVVFLSAVAALVLGVGLHRSEPRFRLVVNRAAMHDVSAPLITLRGVETTAIALDCPDGCGTSPGDPDEEPQTTKKRSTTQKKQTTQPRPATQPQAPAQTEPAKAEPTQTQPPAAQPDQPATPAERTSPQRPPAPPPVPPPPPTLPAAAVAVEQGTQGTRPSAVVTASFDGLGFGFEGPQGPGRGAALDNSLAVGPNHIVQVINGAGIAIYTKKGSVFDSTGRVLYGAVPSKTVFEGFGGPCETANFGDVVARYDQIADRWLYVMPIFQRIQNRPEEPYSVCYAVSETPDPMGKYNRYEFRRKLFPDYPRPAIWPDGYYVPSSTGDNVIQKHACIVDRTAMLKGGDATEQCLIIDGVNFLNNADIDGTALPPAGAPNIMMAAGGTQLKGMAEKDEKYFEDDGIYYWKVHVDWQNPKNTAAVGPVKIPVAPYHYLCNGQLTNCVPQPGTTTRLDAQGDKLMQRLVYRNFGDHQSIVAVHSVYSSRGGGGVRWYEFRIGADGNPALFQQGTYAPDEFYRWMASPGMDRAGNIGIGYSFGGAPNFVGQRFAARLASDPPGLMGFRETVLVNGQGVQARGNRWTDYATTAMDPSDDCTFWYVGDYFKDGATALSTRIGGFRLPGCLERKVAGYTFFDINHNGKRDPGEPGIAGVEVAYNGGQAGRVKSGANGSFTASLPADPIYSVPTFNMAATPSKQPGWVSTTGSLIISLTDPSVEPVANFGSACTVPNRGGEGPRFWISSKGKSLLATHNPAWHALVKSIAKLELPEKEAAAITQFQKWMDRPSAMTELVALKLSVSFGGMDGKVTVHDPVKDDWPTVDGLMTRAAANPEPYRVVMEQLNANTAPVTPAAPAACGGY